MHDTLRYSVARPFALGMLLWVGFMEGGSATLAAEHRAPISEKSAENAAPYSLQQRESIWSLVTPEGKPFFSRGVCCVIPGGSKDNYDPENPEFAFWRYYTNDTSWARTAVQRLQTWGFTTAGGWSDARLLRQVPGMTLGFTPVLHIGSTAGAPWWDMWDPKIIQRMDEIARNQILALRDDPRLIGYYSDNELGWWNATLFKMTLDQASSSGQRQRLIRLLRNYYREDWKRLERDFEVENADGWSSLSRRGMLYLRPGGEGIHVMRQFLGLLADRYYQLVHDIIRKYDGRALILGDRYQSFYYPEVAQACARHVDAVSSNLNASWNDGTWARFYLDTLHKLTQKPILASEYYMAATNNRTGNRNNQGLFPVVGDQLQRALCASNTLCTLARLPYVIGADWFQYFDEPVHGRTDGENYNFGLVDIQDKPYAELVSAFTAIDANQLKTQPAVARQDASGGVPPAPAFPLADFAPMTALKNWDRERGFVKPDSALPLADLYLCWTPKAVYVGLYAMDIIEDAYYSGRSLPKIDRPLWIVKPTNHEPVRARLGAGREPLVSNPAVRVWNLSGLNLDTRNVAIMEIPAAQLGKTNLQSGDHIEFDVSLDTHSRAYRTTWHGSFTLAN